MDFFSGLTAMTQEAEAHGKTWILIDSIRQNAEKTHTFWIAVEKSAQVPAPMQIILIPNKTDSNGEKPE